VIFSGCFGTPCVKETTLSLLIYFISTCSKKNWLLKKIDKVRVQLKRKIDRGK